MADRIFQKISQSTESTIDLASEQIVSLMQQIRYIPLLQHLTTCQNLLMLDLSSNKIKHLMPLGTSVAALTALKLPNLRSLNISDNPIVDVKHTAKTIAYLMPSLTDLQLSLFDEADVDVIIQSLPKLMYLNNLEVERPSDSSIISYNSEVLQKNDRGHNFK